jgi:hypothetical protein
LLLAVAVLATAAPANAAPFLLDAGAQAEDPFVAVDEVGTGHFAWVVHRPEAEGGDVAVYCQVPRNAKACAVRRDLSVPGAGNANDFAGPKVLLPGEGRVLVITQRCCRTGASGLFLFDSTDNGQTFAPGREVGTNEPSGDAILGPGEFTFSTISSITTGGTRFQAAPIDAGFTEDIANVAENGQGVNNPHEDGQLALIDAFTPLAAMSDGSSVFWRKGPSTGAYNTLSSWGPLVKYDAGDTPRLAYGPRGVFLLYQTDFPDRRLRAVRWDGSAFSGPKRDVSGDNSSAYEPDFFQDPNGTLHAVWRQNGDPYELRHRTSTDGSTWKPREVLAKSDTGFFGTRVSAAVDGGGFATWDENGSVVRAVQFGSTKPVSEGGGEEDPNCVPSLQTKTAKVLATESCFKKQNGVYTTDGDVRVNGIDIITPGDQSSASGASVAGAKASVTVNKADGKISAKGQVETRVGTVTLDKGGFKWDVPSTAGAAFKKFTGIEKFKVELLGFPVTGSADLTFDKAGKAIIAAHLKMPPFLGGIAADANLLATQSQGLVLKDFKVKLDGAELFGLGLKNVVVEYLGDEPPVFKGQATFILPGGSQVTGYFEFVNGDFGKAGFNATLPTPITLVAAPVPIFLTDIGFRLDVKPDTIVSGGVRIAAGANINGKAPVAIAALPTAEALGGFSIKFGKPIVLRAGGALEVVGIKIASGEIVYQIPDLFSLKGQLDYSFYGLASLEGAMSGFLDLSDGRFNYEVSGDVCVGICFGGSGVISTKGISGCAEGSLGEAASGALGFGATWAEIKTLDIDGDNVLYDFEVGGGAECDMSPWKEAPPAGAAVRAAQVAATDFTVPGGTGRIKVGFVGSTASPDIVVTAPDGRTIQTTASPGGAAVDERTYLYRLAGTNYTELIVKDPPAGKWTVTTKPGSSSIAKVLRADELPEPKVSAKVTGKGQKRKLVYKVNKVPGQRVTIYERSGTASSTIVANQTGDGTKAFKPAYGAKGKRDLVATIESYGRPRDIRVVGSYTAPAPPKPSKPGRVIAKRKGTTLRIKWLPARDALSYIVRVRLRDGTNRLFPTEKRSLKVGGVAPGDAGSITVAAIDRAGQKGPASKVKVKKKKRRKRP